MKAVIPSDRADLSGKREPSEITGCFFFFTICSYTKHNRLGKKYPVLSFKFECIIMTLLISVTDGNCINKVCYCHKQHGRNGVGP